MIAREDEEDDGPDADGWGDPDGSGGPDAPSPRLGGPLDLRAVEVLYASLRPQMLQGAEAADAGHRPAQEDLPER